MALERITLLQQLIAMRGMSEEQFYQAVREHGGFGKVGAKSIEKPWDGKKLGAVLDVLQAHDVTEAIKKRGLEQRRPQTITNETGLDQLVYACFPTFNPKYEEQHDKQGGQRRFVKGGTFLRDCMRCADITQAELAPMLTMDNDDIDKVHTLSMWCIGRSAIGGLGAGRDDVINQICDVLAARMKAHPLITFRPEGADAGADTLEKRLRSCIAQQADMKRTWKRALHPAGKSGGSDANVGGGTLGHTSRVWSNPGRW
jgi:hypothetical protein